MTVAYPQDARCRSFEVSRAADDLARASDIARSMVMHYGMDEGLGLVAYEQQHGSFLAGRPEDYVEARKYSEATARDIDQAVLGIIKAAFDKATDILSQRRKLLTKCAQQLLEHETLSRKALLELLDKDSPAPKLVKHIEPG